MSQAVAVVLAAIIAAGVTGIVGWLTHRRATRADELERQHRRDEKTAAEAKAKAEAANEHIDTITSAQRLLVRQLREEVDRLIEARKADRVEFEVERAELHRRIEQLEAIAARETMKVMRLEERMDREVGKEGPAGPEPSGG